MKKLTDNFTLQEFEKSSTAKRLNIDNTIPEVYIPNVMKLASTLQTIRNYYKQPIIIDSGYRCERLNRIVGGSRTSDHLYAAAADFHSVTDTLADNMKLWNVIIKLRDEGKIYFRQLIFEYGRRNSGPNWLHLAINHNKAAIKNNQILYIGV